MKFTLLITGLIMISSFTYASDCIDEIGSVDECNCNSELKYQERENAIDALISMQILSKIPFDVGVVEELTAIKEDVEEERMYLEARHGAEILLLTSQVLLQNVNMNVSVMNQALQANVAISSTMMNQVLQPSVIIQPHMLLPSIPPSM
ncbi:MAG: hypothetical protein OCD01_05075 [Fibrobacterales bacterium]